MTVRRWMTVLTLAGAALAPAIAAGAQQAPSRFDEVAPAVRTAVSAPYLSEDERRERRVFHGLWEEGDLAPARLRARAALMAGAWDDPSLDDESADAEDRAAARVRRGDLREALEVLAGASSLRAARLRAEALEGLGRFDEADAALDPVVQALTRREAAGAEEIVEGVRALAIRARLRGTPAEDYQWMMSMLAQAREADPLHWPAALTEARLLHAKDNREQAQEAARQALSLNPRCGGALALLAKMSVEGFNFDGTEALAAMMDEDAASVSGPSEGAFSPWADVWLAHAMLRQNDPDLAEELLAPTLERFPKMRDAVATRVAIEAVRYDKQNTEDRLAAFDELSPGSPLALYTAGKALAENRQYEYAAELLERAIERQPNWPAPIVELGLMEMQSGRDQRAIDALRRATELDPFQKRARNSLDLVEDLVEQFETVESEHFVVRFQPGPDRVMAEEMLPTLERIHQRVAGEFGHEPDRKTVIELMPDHQWFAVRITGMPALHTIAAATGPLIAMEAPKVGPRHSGVYDWPRVVQHEYAHTITLSRTKNRIPHWFTEAAAVNVEDAPRDYDTARLLASALEGGDLFDMEEINIAFVRPEKPSDRSQAYAQGAWMYEFMVERFGEDAPLRLMDLYAQGVREREAMASALGVSRDAFYERFVEWAREDVRTWGMLPEPSIQDLLVRATLEDPDARAPFVGALLEHVTAEALRGGGVIAPRPIRLPLVELTPARLASLLDEHTDHPGLLERMLDQGLDAGGGELDGSLASIAERYAEARPVDPKPHRLLARHYLAAGDRASIEKAIPHLRYLDAREQDTATYAIELSRRLAQLERWDEAAQAAERTTRLAPFDPAHRELAATVAIKRGDMTTAERHIAALVTIEPDQSIHRRRLEAVRRMQSEASG